MLERALALTLFLGVVLVAGAAAQMGRHGEAPPPLDGGDATAADAQTDWPPYDEDADPWSDPEPATDPEPVPDPADNATANTNATTFPDANSTQPPPPSDAPPTDSNQTATPPNEAPPPAPPPDEGSSSGLPILGLGAPQPDEAPPAPDEAPEPDDNDDD